MTETTNIHGTDEGNLTSVLPEMDLYLLRRGLIIMREGFGADTPKGHRCSNLVGQIDNYNSAIGEQKTNLEKLIRGQLDDLQ